MTEQNKEDSNEENRPLTPSDWVMFLSGEINKWHSIPITICTFVIAVLALVVILNADNTTIFIVLILCVVEVLMVFPIYKDIGKLTDIRNDIIYEKLKKYDEIRERCEEAGLFKQSKIVRFIRWVLQIETI
ncbi:MAG: hypothetical protein EMLJLAPB_00654 [Candidatus Argoarchaeum ethanivorans]|uniref:Uncharacterized protein n=1 Tax=Candidatus Argoarchaeum ethanivorans TaxID=2608793 RepID=A0A811TDQ9_9EURY|nr:MAG: hypothetical protein EMLJLAPB_00654 [Candidatus Argoarchaeum ethanivorans]